MNYLEYEKFCKNLWEKKHPQQKVYLTKKGKFGEDGGVDLIIKKGNKILYGQCKHYFKEKVLKVCHIRELKGVMARDNIEKGVFFSSIPFSKKAWQEAKKDKIWLEYTK